MHVLIVGHGEMGRSFEAVLERRAQVFAWEKNLETGEENRRLEEVAATADAAILAVPATPHRDIAQRLSHSLPASALVLTIAKGMNDDGEHPLEILVDVFGKPRVAGVYGPMIGDELLEGRPGFADIATFDAACTARVRELFSGTTLHLVAGSPDSAWNAAWSAVLKNVYVPLFGAVDEFGYGDNAEGLLAVAVLEEMRVLAGRLGGNGKPLTGLSGLGDLFTTASSAGSHHRAAGAALARGDRSALGLEGANLRGEGFHSLRMLKRRKGLSVDDLDVFALADCLLEDTANFRRRFDAWLAERPT